MATESSLLSILIIGESEEALSLYNRLFYESPYLPEVATLYSTNSLKEALFILQKESFDLIMTNLFLFDSQGLETFIMLNKNAPHIPIIVLIREGDETLAFDAISLGAEDCLLLEEKDSYVIARVLRNALERRPVRESLKTLSFTDELTKIYNRRGFITFAQQQIEIAAREHRGFYLFLIDLDHLKEVNDTFGHKIGDNAIIGAAHCIKKAFRGSDIIGRIGGDEFAVLAIGAHIEEGETMISHLNEILTMYNQSNSKETHPYYLSLTIGFAYFSPEEKPSLEELLEKADIELYKRKRS